MTGDIILDSKDTELYKARKSLESLGFKTHTETRYNKHGDINGYKLHGLKASNIVDGQLVELSFARMGNMKKDSKDLLNNIINKLK